MIGFFVRRSFGAAATLVLATMVVFTITFVVPGDPAVGIAGARRDQATIDAIRARYHLDDPIVSQYVRWLGRLVRGDLGESYVARRPVSAMLVEAIPTTARLVVLTLFIQLAIGLIFGAMSAQRKGGLVDGGVLAACTLGLSVPLFIVGVVAQDLLGVRLGVVPVSGTTAGLSSYVLPALVLAIPGVAVGTRLVRSEVLSNLAAPHVATAVAKGMGSAAVTRRHVVRNSLGPIVAFAGVELGTLMGGAIVVERVFNLPGVGRSVAAAIGDRDHPLILGITMFTIVVYLAVDLAVDLVVMALDPRIQDRVS